jgi:hypothetical protein
MTTTREFVIFITVQTFGIFQKFICDTNNSDNQRNSSKR